MHRARLTVWVAVVAAMTVSSALVLGQAPASRVTAFQGGRVIVGDGRVLDRLKFIRPSFATAVLDLQRRWFNPFQGLHLFNPSRN